MSSYNKVLLMGNLTREPEVRSLPSGQAVTEIGIASNRTYTVGGPGGEKKEEVTFVDVSFWGRKGEVVAQYFKRGDPIFIEGRLSFRQWENKEGQKRSKLSVTGENFEFINGRKEGGGQQGGGQQGGAQQGGAPQGGAQQSGGYEGQAASGGAGGAGGGGMEGFDEVPF
jgi:single-strand DNA-binding protein